MAALLVFSGMGSGCYLAHVASGQVRLLFSRTPVERVLADPATPARLREQLLEVDAVRRYAADLGLAVGGRYTDYAPWPGDAIVTSVVATRPGEVEPVTTWFPIVGRVPYRGYFDPERAAAFAASLRADALDTCLVKVRAYSTLGWFDDPLTGPMLRQPQGAWVETLFHELLHATVFVPGDADWNEGVAAFFGQEARVRFYAAREGAEAGERERRAVARQRRLHAELLALRREVEALYTGEPSGPEREARREALARRTRERLAALAPGVAALSAPAPETASRAGWSERVRLNDACLAIAGTYHGDTPHLEGVLAALDGDLAAFLAAVEGAAAGDDPRGALLGPRAGP